MYKAVIFDFDYTLGDSTNGIVLSINHALEKLGFRAQDTKTIQRTIGLSLKDTLFELTGIQDEETAQKFTQYFKEKADEVMVDNTRLYEGVLAFARWHCYGNLLKMEPWRKVQFFFGMSRRQILIPPICQS